MEPGRPAREVFLAVKREAARQKLPFFMPHVGHGLESDCTKHRSSSPPKKTPLEAGMVLNVEPIVSFPDEGECYHMEDLARHRRRLRTADDTPGLLDPHRHLIHSADGTPRRNGPRRAGSASAPGRQAATSGDKGGQGRMTGTLAPHSNARSSSASTGSILRPPTAGAFRDDRRSGDPRAPSAAAALHKVLGTEGGRWLCHVQSRPGVAATRTRGKP